MITPPWWSLEGDGQIKLQISVHDLLIDPAPTGNINEGPDDSFGDPVLGTEIHEAIQGQMRADVPGYRVEVPLRKSIEVDKCSVAISGRVDGIHPDGSIDEIKTTFRPARLIRNLELNPEHPYWLQLACYRWMSGTSCETPDRILVVDARSMESESIESQHWTPESFDAWAKVRIEAIIEREKDRRAFVKRQKKLASQIRFPFSDIRDGQLGFIEEIRSTCAAKGRLLGQAPTGIGKSLGSLFPALEVALAAGTKVAFLTPKNSQFNVAEKAVQQIATGSKANLRSITLGAKSKLCLNVEVNCTADACPYAKGHYDKVLQNDLLKKLSRRAVLTVDSLRAAGKKYEVCPHALSLQLLPRRDVLIGDYNHAFSPDANLRAKMSGPDLVAPRPVVLIDEAHNLPDRARDHWSGALAVADAAGTKWERALKRILTGTSKGPPSQKKLEALRQKIMDAILDQKETEPSDLKLFFTVNGFTSLLDAAKRNDHFFLRNPEAGCWEIHCLDASEFTAQKFDDFDSVVAFSATLKPLEFYRNEIGLIRDNDQAIEWPSPFDVSHQKTIVIPQVSTLWRNRSQNYEKIAGAVLRIAALKSGHYVAFFPSFSFLNSVASILHEKSSGMAILTQTAGQSSQVTESILSRMRTPQPGVSALLLAVQGGTFAEGIDLPGDQLIGAFVVGPGLPAVSPVREKMREYFDAKYGCGFDYAYTYPAMAKSVQAAGRVIRTADDRGIVVFMDPRFLEPASQSAMPSQWIDHIHEARHGESLNAHINTFWS